MAALDNIASELLKSANEADLNYKKTRDQAQRDKAVRLRRIVENLRQLSSGTSTLDQVTTAGNTTANTINVGGITSDYFQLDTAATPTPVQGMMFWDSDRSTVDVQLDNDVSAKIGQDNFWYVKNQSGATIPKGKAVMAVGTLGSSGRILIDEMVANGSISSKFLLGITAEDIANGADGFVMNIGKLRQLDTSVWPDGTVLYCDPTTAGNLTSTKPSSPNLALPVAFVVHSAANGVLAIRVSILDENAFNTPTLAQVTTAGNTTTNNITVGGVTVGQVGGSGVISFPTTVSGHLASIYSVYAGNKIVIQVGSRTFNLDGGGQITTNFNTVITGSTGAAALVVQQGNAAWSPVADFNGSAGTALRVNTNGNILIGTTTDAGYKLDVNGTANVTTSIRVGAAGNTFTSITDSAFNISRTGDGALVVRLEGPTVLNATRSIGRITAREGVQLAYDTAPRLQVYSTTISIGIGAFDTNLGYDATSVLHVLGSKTASSAIARGVYFNNTLVAAANNDVLVGLDINPTFTNGAFTGVTNLAARIQGNTEISRSGADTQLIVARGSGASFTIQAKANSTSQSEGVNLYWTANTWLKFVLGSSVVANFSNVGNLLVGTSTDSGYKLDVVGADSRFNGVRVGLGAGGVSTNTVVGNGALNANTTGSGVTAIGYQSLYSNTTASNTAVGYQALNANTTGGGNTAVGFQSSFLNSVGANNSSFGFYSLRSNTAFSNTAIGYYSLFANVSGSNNTAVGTDALRSNTAASNTAVGTQAGYSNTSGGITAVGYRAGYNNTSGTNLTALGFESSFSNVTSTGNTSIGFQALYANTAANNTAIGDRSLTATTTGTANTAIGSLSMRSNVDGGVNVALGVSSLFSNISGNNNIAVGYQSLFSNTASNNTALGYQAGQAGVANTTGANNIFIGYQATGVSATESNRTWIGNSSTTSTWLAGNVLIGTTTNAGFKLDVAGTGRFTNNLSIAKSYNVTWGTNQQINVTDYPAYYSSGYNVMSFISSSSGAVAEDGSFVWRNVGTSSNLMVLTGKGSLGLGTTPTEKLHIVDNTTGNKFARISAGAADASAAWVAQNDQVDNIVYRVFGSGVAGFQMGVALARSASLIANLGGTGKFLIGTYSATDLVFGTNDQERMRLVNNTGNFLIGTLTDVGTKLNVSGDVNALGYRVNNVVGYTGILNIPGNPPGQQNVDIQGGIIINIF